MKRILLIATLALCAGACLFAQETSGAQENPMTGWKWANFLILAAGLGYLIGKNVPPLFRKQSEDIQKALAEAAKIKHEAALYASSVETRLANVQREIDELYKTARAEMTAESERVRQETERHLTRIREQAVQEVALMTRGAKDELRKYAAELAVGLAGERIRARMTPAAQQKLVGGFLTDLHHRGTQAASN